VHSSPDHESQLSRGDPRGTRRLPRSRTPEKESRRPIGGAGRTPTVVPPSPTGQPFRWHPWAKGPPSEPARPGDSSAAGRRAGQFGRGRDRLGGSSRHPRPARAAAFPPKLAGTRPNGACSAGVATCSSTPFEQVLGPAPVSTNRREGGGGPELLRAGEEPPGRERGLARSRPDIPATPVADVYVPPPTGPRSRPLGATVATAFAQLEGASSSRGSLLAGIYAAPVRRGGGGGGWGNPPKKTKQNPPPHHTPTKSHTPHQPTTQQPNQNTNHTTTPAQPFCLVLFFVLPSSPSSDGRRDRFFSPHAEGRRA